MDTFNKLNISLRYFLLGKEYYRAADALQFMLEYHTGKRKDGVTPEAQHQIEITHYLRTLLPSLTYPEDTLIVALLHDTSEDYAVPNEVIQARFGDRVAAACFLLDKNGKTSEWYFASIAINEIASIVKGADRIHNLQTMVGVFNANKQLNYIVEVKHYFLPMLKKARRMFSKQEAAYENIKHMLLSQITLLEEALKGKAF
jgi:(p)ppGpp synthase/HD superfamily hydrolase